MATLATPVEDAAMLFDPNTVKLVRRDNGDALYFSRAPLPWARDAFAPDRTALPGGGTWLRHLGILDRTSAAEGKRVSVRVHLGGRGNRKQQITNYQHHSISFHKPTIYSHRV